MFYAFLLGKSFFQTISWVLSLAAFYQLRSTFSKKEQLTNQSVIYYQCSGIIINGNVKCSQTGVQVTVTSFILSGTIFDCKIVILRNFDVRNRNGEISLEKQNDSTKIVGISD